MNPSLRQNFVKQFVNYKDRKLVLLKTMIEWQLFQKRVKPRKIQQGLRRITTKMQMQIQTIERLDKDSDMQKDLIISEIALQAQEFHYHKGQIILDHWDPINEVIFVLEG